MRRLFCATLILLLCSGISSDAFWQSRDSSYNQNVPGSPGCPYLAQSCAIFAAFNNPPTTAYKIAINNLVAALLANPSNVWGKLDYLYVPAAADSQSALINWKNPGTATLTAVSSPTFTANKGYSSDGSTSYLASGVSFTSGSQLTQNSISLGGWLLGSAPTNGGIMLGPSANTSYFALVENNAGNGNLLAQLANSLAFDQEPEAAMSGYAVAVRTGASATTLYYNNVALGSPNSTSNAVGTGNANLLNYYGAGGAFSDSTSIVAMAFWGGQMTSQDVSNTCGAFANYLIAVGGIVSSPCTIGAQAQRAKNFTNSVGVVDPLGTPTAAAGTAMSNMGMTVARAVMPTPGDGGGNYNYLAANDNVRFNFLWINGPVSFPTIDCDNASAGAAASIALMNTFVTTYPGKMLANEGPNETNNFPICYVNTGTTNNTTSTSSAVLHFAATPAEVETVGNYSFTLSGTGTVNAGTGITVIDATQTVDPGSNYNSCASCSSGGFSVSITINSPNECLIGFTATNSGAVTNVTDTLGLSWALRATNGAGQPEEEFYALGPTSGGFPQTDTISFNAPSGFIAAGVVGIVGCNTSSPFDGSAVVGTSDPLTISTSHTNTIVLGGFRMSSTAAPTAGSGYTQLGNGFYTLNEYQTFTSTQSGLSVTIGTGAGNANGAIADAIVLNAAAVLPAIAPGTTVVSATGTTLTMSANAINGGVKSGDLIQFSAQGVTGPSAAPLPQLEASVASSLLWQALIYNVTQADATLTGAGVQVANYTSYFGNTTPQPPSIAGTANYNNIHFYPFSGTQPTTYVGSTMVAALNPANQPIVGAPTVITEGGYCTPSAQSGAVDQTTQARLEMNIYFDMFTAGVPYTTLYTLFDFNTGDGACIDNYGFYQSDQATIKANGTAVKNTYTILNDTGGTALTFTPGQFNYSISGLPVAGSGGGNSLLLEKSNGTWEIVVWKEPTIWNDTTHSQVTPSTSSLTVSLPITATTVNVYDPIVSTTPTTTHSTSSVSVSLGADVQIVEVIP
jgi:hypothetical protein